MEIKALLTSLDDIHFLTDKSVLCFRGKQEYPLLFLSSILKKIKTSITIEMVDVSEQEFTQIVGRLQTSFLGTRVLYWLRNISDLNQTKKKTLLDYIRYYNGPNIIAFFATYDDVPKINTGWVEIPLPDEIETGMFAPLMHQLFDIKLSRAKSFTSALAKRHKQLPLDTVCLLAHYDEVLGKNISIFLDEWLDQLVIPKSSLFILSKYFFAKDARSFFSYWLEIEHVYTPQFWMVFWSEQLWRASGYIMFARKKQHGDAKQISFRLPFTFLQKDWRSYSVRELKNAHQFIYATDYNLKHGSSTMAFDLFFSKFFCNQFV
jgi:hypothetical protein